MSKKRIYLIRHGESQSQSGETTDTVNPDLSALGIAQAKRLVPILNKCHPQLILLSPLQRAWKTFQLSQIKASQQRFDSRLVEAYPPEFFAARLPIATPEIAQQDDLNGGYALSVGERYQALWDDMLKSPYQDIMCFCHWNTCGHLLRAALGIDVADRQYYAKMDNAALSIIDIDEDGRHCVRVWNYTEHLNGLLPEDDTLGFLR